MDVFTKFHDEDKVQTSRGATMALFSWLLVLVLFCSEAYEAFKVGEWERELGGRKGVGLGQASLFSLSLFGKPQSHHAHLTFSPPLPPSLPPDGPHEGAPGGGYVFGGQAQHHHQPDLSRLDLRR